MAFLSNLHDHTVFSDGANTVDEMVLEAISLHFVSIGISDHSYVPHFLESLSLQNTKAYFSAIQEAKRKYQGQIEVYCGIEMDGNTPQNLYDLSAFDYIIGSVHDLMVNGEPISVDHTVENLKRSLTLYSPNFRDTVQLYYDCLIRLAQDRQPDILGHPDLIRKLNGGNRFFDESAGWYLDLTRDVAKALAQTPVIAEINTGGITRGYRQDPYPAAPFLKALCEAGVPITLSSDAHRKEDLAAGFSLGATAAKNAGYTALMQLVAGEFIPTPIMEKQKEMDTLG